MSMSEPCGTISQASKYIYSHQRAKGPPETSFWLQFAHSPSLASTVKNGHLYFSLLLLFFAIFSSKLKCRHVLLLNIFLLLFMSFIVFFSTIYMFHYTISTYFLPLFIVFSAKIFQFQQNKQTLRMNLKVCLVIVFSPYFLYSKSVFYF